MKQGTIAFLILLLAALVLGLVFYAAGGTRFFFKSAEQGGIQESGNVAAGAALSTETSESISDNTVAQQDPGENGEEDPKVLPEGMEWGLQYKDYYVCSDTGELILSSRHEYDPAGHPVRLCYYTPTEFTEEYQYDTEGHLLRRVRTDASGEALRTDVNSYDEEGRLIRSVHYEREKVIGAIDYLYDEQGRDWREVWYSPQPAEREAEQEDTASGNAAGSGLGTDTASGNATGADTDNDTVSENTAGDGAEPQPVLEISLVMEYKYDADGNIAKYWSFFADGKIAGPWEEYEYDEEGQMSAVIKRDSDGTLLAKEIYTYYSEDNISSVISTDDKGNVFYQHYRDYDSQGQLIHTETRSDELVTWQLYQYDENGRRTELHDNGGEWIYIYDEETGLLTTTERYANVGLSVSAENITGRTEYIYQPVPAGTAYLPEIE